MTDLDFREVNRKLQFVHLMCRLLDTYGWMWMDEEESDTLPGHEDVTGALPDSRKD